MSTEYALTRVDASRVRLPDTPATLTVPRTLWWVLTKVGLVGLLVTYLVGMVQDVRRVHTLRAEPPSLSKIITITKNEAWQRIHGRQVRSTPWVARPRRVAHDLPTP